MAFNPQKKVTFLTADGFEESELLKPRAAFEAAGASEFDALLLPGGVHATRVVTSVRTARCAVMQMERAHSAPFA